MMLFVCFSLSSVVPFKPKYNTWTADLLNKQLQICFGVEGGVLVGGQFNSSHSLFHNKNVFRYFGWYWLSIITLKQNAKRPSAQSMKSVQKMHLAKYIKTSECFGLTVLYRKRESNLYKTVFGLKYIKFYNKVTIAEI